MKFRIDFEPAKEVAEKFNKVVGTTDRDGVTVCKCNIVYDTSADGKLTKFVWLCKASPLGYIKRKFKYGRQARIRLGWD